jgi:Fe-S oxidoreductase
MSEQIENHKEAVVKSINAVKQGPRVLKLYMDMCAKCGTCASVCPVYFGKQDPKYNPANRSDLIRGIYKRHNTLAGKILGRAAGAADFDEKTFDTWSERFYSCTACRRCAQFCPFGIDNSVITRKGRTILDSLGKTPKSLERVVSVSREKGNTDGASAGAFKSAVAFLEEEMQEEHGVDIKIPIDVVGAEYFYVPPSGDIVANHETTMGIAKVFHVLGLGNQWTTSSKYFDGANYGLFTGNDAHMKEINKPVVEEAKRLQCKVLFMGECGHAYRVMKRMMESAKWWGDLPFKIVNCLEWTADRIRNGEITFDRSKNPQPITYHDPCNFAKSCNIIEAPRTILRAACADFREMTPSGAENWCCGAGGGLAAMDELKEFKMTVSGKKKREQIKATGASHVAAACANCKRQLHQLMEYHKDDVTVGGVHGMVSRSILINGRTSIRPEYDI